MGRPKGILHIMQRPLRRDGEAGDGPIAALGDALPFVILAYVALLAAMRLGFSSNLEIDEAEFVGLVDWRWVYANAHPPLFNWLARIGLELTGWNWPLAVSMVKYGALAVFHLSTWCLARKLGGPRSAAMAVAASAFLPQIVWMSATTMAHTTLAMGCAAATALTLYGALAARATLPRWLWFAALGLCAAAGMLSKYSFGLLLAPLLASVLIDRQLRRRLLRTPAFAGLILFIAPVAAMLHAALNDPTSSASRIDRLYDAGGLAASLGPQLAGLTGVFSLITAVLAWSAPLFVVWFLALRWEGHGGTPSGVVSDRLADRFVTALGRTIAGGLLALAVLIPFTDVQNVHTRYLTPLLCVVPVWLALRWPLARSAAIVGATALCVYLLVLPGFWAQVSFSNHRFAIPFDDLAGAIARATDGQPMPIVANRHDDAANAILALGWPGAAAPKTLTLAVSGKTPMFILLWRGGGAPPVHLIPDGYRADTPVETVALRYRDALSNEIVFSLQRFTGP